MNLTCCSAGSTVKSKPGEANDSGSGARRGSLGDTFLFCMDSCMDSLGGAGGQSLLRSRGCRGDGPVCGESRPLGPPRAHPGASAPVSSSSRSSPALPLGRARLCGEWPLLQPGLASQGHDCQAPAQGSAGTCSPLGVMEWVAVVT